jgi:hypothetical protein
MSLKDNASYQGIALAIPQFLRTQPPFRGRVSLAEPQQFVIVPSWRKFRIFAE